MLGTSWSPADQNFPASRPLLTTVGDHHVHSGVHGRVYCRPCSSCHLGHLLHGDTHVGVAMWHRFSLHPLASAIIILHRSHGAVSGKVDQDLAVPPVSNN